VQLRVGCRAGIAGRHEDALHALALGQFPGQGMFSATAAYDEDFQALNPRTSGHASSHCANPALPVRFKRPLGGQRTK
jgi:hypothetical protein